MPDPELPNTHYSTLMGSTAQSMRLRFGTPQQIRREGPAEVWIYQARACHLDLILERPPAQTDLRVIYVGARMRDGLAAADKARCIRDLDAAAR